MNRLWRFALTVLLVCAMAALYAAAPAEETPGDAEEPAKEVPGEPTEATAEEPTAEALRERVISLATQTGLTDELIALFKEYAFAQAKEKLGVEVPADFWPWLSEHKTIRDGLLVALHPNYSADIVKRLQQLREKFGTNVDTHPHLALAFAVVFGRAGGQPPWGRYASYLRDDRKAPTMEQSFRYYVRAAKSMRGSLTKTPWLLLAFVVDNETPIAERVWALKTYGRSSRTRFASLYSDPHYDWDKLKGHPDIGDRPRSLPNIREYGGVCVDRAYFASRVYKSFGVPAMGPWGVGKGANHAWVAWFVPKGRTYELEDRGRYWSQKYYKGHVWSPLERKQILDKEVYLLAVAVAQDYNEYLNARIGCYVYGMFGGDDRKGRTGLLKESIKRNRGCAEAWRLLADASAEGIIDIDESEELFEAIIKTLSPCPDLTCEVLERIMAQRLQATEDPDEKEVERNLRIMGRAFKFYNQTKRPDLAVALVLMQGSYLESLGRRKDALKLYAMASESYAKEHYGFQDAFDRVLQMLDGPRNLKKRLVFCAVMVEKVPRQRGWFDKKLKRLNPSYIYVVRAYIRTLQAAGNERLAQKWTAKIERKEKT